MMIMVSFAIISCNKEKSGNDTMNATSLPTKAESFINDNYPDATIDYVVTLTNSTAAGTTAADTMAEAIMVTITTVEGSRSILSQLSSLIMSPEIFRLNSSLVLRMSS